MVELVMKGQVIRIHGNKADESKRTVICITIMMRIYDGFTWAQYL